MRQFSLAEQTALISARAKLIEQAGGRAHQRLCAGSFGVNRDTLRALAANGIRLDSSYNATMFGIDSGVCPGSMVLDAIECDGVQEYPITVFNQGLSSMRHVQLTACSFAEIAGLLWQALESKRGLVRYFFSDNFELLSCSTRPGIRPDEVVVTRL